MSVQQFRKGLYEIANRVPDQALATLHLAAHIDHPPVLAQWVNAADHGLQLEETDAGTIAVVTFESVRIVVDEYENYNRSIGRKIQPIKET